MKKKRARSFLQVKVEIDTHQIVFNGDAITLQDEYDHDLNFNENN